MKKYLFSAVCLLLAITVLFSACTGSSTQGEKSTESPHDSDSSFRVAIVQFDNDSFTNELRQMFIKRMRLLGYDEAKMKFDIKNAQGNSEKLSQTASSLSGGDYDIVVAIGDKCACALANAGCTVPTVFVAVSDPVGLGLASGVESPDKNMTGTVSNTSEDNLLSYIRVLTPKVSSVAVICMNNEKSIAEKDSVVKYLSNDLFDVEPVILDSTDSIDSVVADVLTRNGAIFLTNDEELKNVSANVVNLASQSSKFVFSSNIACIENGVLAATASPVKDLSYTAAEDADKILKGAKVSDIPIKTDIAFAIYVSKSTAESFNIDVPKIDNVILF
jgi:putative tryptophan/tyrosine transport system substrate-binding protein